MFIKGILEAKMVNKMSLIVLLFHFFFPHLNFDKVLYKRTLEAESFLSDNRLRTNFEFIREVLEYINE